MNNLVKILDMLSSGDYASIASIYFTSRLIIAYSANEDYETTILTSQALHKALFAYQKVISPKLINDHLQVWSSLCDALCRTGLDQDYRAFFEVTAPDAVFDWSTFLNYFPAADVGKILVALTLILNDVPPESLIISNEWLYHHYIASEKIYKKINLNFDGYTRCWHGVHYMDLASSEHHPSTAIVQVAKFYHNLQIPMSDLLSDYASLYLEQGDIAALYATRGGRKKSRKTSIAEGGRSEQDIELDRKLKALSQELPTEVIRGLFYPPARNDAGLECTYILHKFYAKVAPNDHVLVINPSPDILLNLNKKYLYSEPTIWVTDETLAQLYSKQFGCMNFLSPNSPCDNIHRYNRILLTPRDVPMDSMLDCLNLASSDALLTALIPEKALTEINEKLYKVGLCIHTILSVPSGATHSSPRRKVLLEANGYWKASYFLLQHGLCDASQTLFCIIKNYYKIPSDWISSQMTIADMRRAVRQNPVTKHSLEPRIVRYSPEINFWLTIQHECKGRVAGRVCYRKILRPEDVHRKRGDRLTPIIEKGLRKRTESDVIEAIELVSLDERIAPIVVADILDFYDGRLMELSLKTAWYCLRCNLLTIYGYREDTVLELLSGSGNALALLNIGTSTLNDYEEAMSSVFKEVLVPKKYWQQLHLILSIAKSAGYISINPLEHYLPLVNAQLTKRQQDARNALMKKSFEIAEEKMLIASTLSTEGSYEAWMTTDPLALIIPLSMMAVPRLKESLALRWANMVPNFNLGTYHFQLTHYLSNDGTTQALVKQSVIRHRCVPLAPQLVKVLLNYKAFLKKTYDLTDDELALCPIILEDHSILKKSINAAKFCRFQTASAKIRTYISQLNIPPNEIILPDDEQSKTTDLNRYAGNIFYTNLKYHLRHSCKFTESELCYVLGLKAPNTFAAHYCAFDHPLLQHRMSLKLNRWIGKLTQDISTYPATNYQSQPIDASIDLIFKGTDAGLSHADISIIFQNNEDSEDSELEIYNQNGYEGTIVIIDEGE